MESSPIEKIGAQKGISNHSDGLGRNDKTGVGPGPIKETKKGHWTRLITRPKVDRMEEASTEGVGLKRKVREHLVRENSNAKKEKKQTTKVETKKQSESFTTQMGSAEVTEQLPRKL